MWRVVKQSGEFSHSSTLAHYGVLGMKWGVRKDYDRRDRKRGTKENKTIQIPSPGDYSRYDGTSGKSTQPDPEYIKRKEGYTKTIETKNGISTIHVDGLDDYARYRQQILTYKTDSPSVYAPESVAIKKFNELPRIDGVKSDGYNRFQVNKDGPTYERRNNCFECTIANEMRKRGYDVQANENAGGRTFEYAHAFNIQDSFQVSSTSTDEAYNRIAGQCLSYGEGARGSLNIYWYGGGGHALNWEVKNGQFKIIDTQQSDVDGKASFMDCDPSDIRVVRLDNAEALPGVTDFVEAVEYSKDAFDNIKWKKPIGETIKDGMKTVASTLKKIGSTAVKKAGELVAKGKEFVSGLFDKSKKSKRKQKKKSSTKEKDSRSFIERLFNIKEVSTTTPRLRG